LSKKKKQRLLDHQRFEEGFPAGKLKKEDRYKKSVIVSGQTEGQKRYILEIKNNDITFCYGPAGTGKTAVATGVALQYMCAAQPAYEKMIVMRPAKEACGEKVGYLPGDLADKMAPWAAPIFDNMEVFIDKSQIRNLVQQGKVEIIPLAFARGRSLNSSFIIVDEAQNVSPEQMLMVLTRLGKGSKMVINGDMAQSDTRGLNGLYDAITRLQNVQGISFVEMSAADIVRHPLIAEILNRYTPPA